MLLELPFQPLRPRADPRQLERAARGTAPRLGLGEAAVVAVETTVAVHGERDVAALAPAREATRPAVQCGHEAAPVEEEDRLAAALGDLAEGGEERRRERVAGLATEIDDLHGRHRGAQPRPELESFEPPPALRPRRGAAVDGDGTLEGGPLRRDSAGVVARVGLLLVRGVVLLVDTDQAEPRNRGEDGRARAHHDRRLACDDPLALVAPLRVGETGVEDRDAIAEAGLEAAERLRRQRDLGHEDDRAAAAFERRRTRLQVDLRLAAAGRAGEEEVAAGSVQSLDEPLERALLRLRQLGRLRLAAHARGRRAPLAAPRPERRRDELERARRRRAVVVGEPEGEIDERRRQLVEDAVDRRRHDSRRCLDARLDHDPAQGRPAEPNGDNRPLADVVRHLVGEDARDRTGRHERMDGGERHRPRLAALSAV